MKIRFMMLALSFGILSCGGTENQNATTSSEIKTEVENPENPTYDPKRGTGKFTKVDISPTIDLVMVKKGKSHFDLKCGSCHRLTSERLVGPGWKGVTARRAPEWIMNFITNTDEMINKDPQVQAQLELCLVRMPNQNLSDDDARSIYEFMRQNDTKKN
jgi:cytochrome c551/c552